jgi:hypothetical protein
LPIKSALLPVMSEAVSVSTSARQRTNAARSLSLSIAAATSRFAAIARRTTRHVAVTMRSGFCMSRTERAARAEVRFSALRASDPINLSNMNSVASVRSVSIAMIVASKTA